MGRSFAIYSDSEIITIVGMWHTGGSCTDIALAIGRSVGQIQDKLKQLRAKGVNLPLRSQADVGKMSMALRQKAREMKEVGQSMGGIGPVSKATFPAFPDWVRFEDDPRARLDMGSARLPPKPAYQSAASSLIGGRW